MGSLGLSHKRRLAERHATGGTRKRRRASSMRQRLFVADRCTWQTARPSSTLVATRLVKSLKQTPVRTLSLHTVSCRPFYQRLMSATLVQGQSSECGCGGIEPCIPPVLIMFAMRFLNVSSSSLLGKAGFAHHFDNLLPCC
jgi:hypothetical protein